MSEFEVQFPENLTPLMEETKHSFLRYLKIEKNYSIHTQSAYLRDLKFFFQFCLDRGVNLAEVEITDVRAYFALLKQSAPLEKKTQSRKLSSLRTFYRFLHRQGYIADNKLLQIHFPKTKKKLPKSIAPQEMTEVLEYIQEEEKSPIIQMRDNALLEVLYSTGVRVFELVNAKKSDLSSDLTTLKVLGKRRKERFVYLGEEAREALKLYLEARILKTQEPLFLNHRGGKLTTRGVRYILDQRRREMGMERSLSPHKFRHTFATDLLDAGAEIRAVQELLGHSSLSSTQVYLSVSQERLKAVYRNAHPHAKSS